MIRSSAFAATAGLVTIASCASADLMTFSGTATVTNAFSDGTGLDDGFDMATAGTSFSFSFTVDTDALANAFVLGSSAQYDAAVTSVSLDFGNGDFLAPLSQSSESAAFANQGASDTLEFIAFYANPGGGQVEARLSYMLDPNTIPGTLGAEFGPTLGDALAQFDPMAYLSLTGRIVVMDGSLSTKAYLEYSVNSLTVTTDSPVVPLPSVAGLGLVGLAGVASRRRR